MLLDFQMTPWTALQTYAKKPFDATLSSLAAFHLKSYRQWHRDPRDAARIPNLYALQETLLDGIRKRAKYRPIAFPAVETPDVSIVIPLHNKFEVTYLCLSALLFAYTAYSFEVILIDDGSTDETVTIAETVTGVTCLRNPTAKGFVESCNRGAAAARGRYTVFLNNDTEVTANWLDELIHAYEDFDDVGLVGSKLIYPTAPCRRRAASSGTPAIRGTTAATRTTAIRSSTICARPITSPAPPCSSTPNSCARSATSAASSYPAISRIPTSP